MIINGIIGTGTFNTGPGVPNSVISSDGDTLLGFNDFEILARCKLMKDSNYLLAELDIKDVANIDNERVIDKTFEGVEFIDSRYTEKNFTVKVWMRPTPGRSVTTLVNEVKDELHPIVGTLKYWNRGEMMSVNSRVASLKFDINGSFKSFTVSFVTQPYFDSSSINSAAFTSTGSSDIVSIGNVGHRVYPQLTITPTGDASAVKIGNTTITKDITTGDVINYDYSTNKALINGVSVIASGRQSLLGVNSSIPISFIAKEILPVLDQQMDALNGLPDNSTFNGIVSNTVIGQAFPTNTITNLKKITLRASNVFIYSIALDMNIYDVKGGTLLTTITNNIYGGQDVSNRTSFGISNEKELEFNIDGDGLDVSSNATLFIEIRVRSLGASGSDVILLPGRTFPAGDAAAEINGIAQAGTLGLSLEGVSTIPYVSTYTNVTAFDTTLTYNNKYV